MPYGTYSVHELRRDSKIKVGDVYDDADKSGSEYASPEQDSVLWAENKQTIVIRKNTDIVDISGISKQSFDAPVDLDKVELTGSDVEQREALAKIAETEGFSFTAKIIRNSKNSSIEACKNLLKEARLAKKNQQKLIINEPATGLGTIQKADTQTTVYQGDATFKDIAYALVNTSAYKVLYNGTVYLPNTVIDVILLDEEGKANIGRLPYGTYTVYELRKDHKAKIGEVWQKDMLGESIYANDHGYLYEEFTDTKSITTNNEVIEFTNKDSVVRGGVAIEKLDRETQDHNPLGQASLLNVEFAITNKSNKAVMVNNKLYQPDEVVMTINTVAEKQEDDSVRYIARTEKDALPYGHYEIRESKVSDGYLYDEMSRQFVKEFSIGYQKDNYQYFTSEHEDIVNMLEVKDGMLNQVIRDGLKFVKETEDTHTRMKNIAFLITSKTTGESHVVVTDENGEFNSANLTASDKTNSNDPDSVITNGAIVKEQDGNYKVVKPELLDAKAGVWFTGLSKDKIKWNDDGKSYVYNDRQVNVDDTLKAFPYDTYEIKELRSKDNEGYKLITAIVTLHESNEDNTSGVDVDYKAINDKPIHIKTELISKDTDSHFAPIQEKTSFVDKLMYENLDKDGDYKTVAELRILDETGKDVGLAKKVVKEFKATDVKGEVAVEFNDVDTSKLKGGMKLVATHVISDKLGVAASHIDLKDEMQSVTIMSIQTQAKGDIANEANAITNEVTLTDTVMYKGLDTTATYNLHGELHYQNIQEDGSIVDGGIVKDKDGKDVVVDMQVQAKDSDGSFEMKFVFVPAKELRGRTTTVFETLTKDNRFMATHADILAKEQTIYFPNIGTQAVDKEDADKYILNKKEAEILDTVKLENLIVGTEYTVDGKLHIKETDANGNVTDGGVLKNDNGEEVTASYTFKAEAVNQTIQLLFKVDASQLAGKSLVAFETLSKDKVVLGIEANIHNEEQTVNVVKLGTTLVDKTTQLHTMSHSELLDSHKTVKAALIDTVQYENLLEGKDYTVKGKLMTTDKDGKAKVVLDANGKEIVAETQFKPEKRNGTVNVEFNFEVIKETDLTHMVAFEEVYLDGKLIGSHADITDKAQTVNVVNIGTTLTGADKKGKTVKATHGVELIDTIKYEGLVEGETYKVSGSLHIQDQNGKDAGILKDADGKEIKVETEFVAKASVGEVEMTFNVNTSALNNGTKLVAFEKMTQKEQLVAVHEDITSEAQTITVEKESVTPKTKKEVWLKTAVVVGTSSAMMMMTISLIGLAYLMWRKKKLVK